MRILIETLSYPPNVSGVAVFTEQLAVYLDKQGHEVHIVMPATKLKSSVTRQGNITVHWIRSYANPLRRGFRLPLLPYFLAGRLVRELQPDAVHINDPMALSHYLAKAARAGNARVIASHHFNLDYVLAYVPKFAHPFSRIYLRQLMRRVYNDCDMVAAPSKTVAASLPKDFGVRVPVVPVSNGVDLHRFYTYFPLEPFRVKYRLPQQKLILYVGRLDKDKSVEVLLKAMRALSYRANAHLVIAGGGKREKRLQRYAAKYLGGRVTFVGRVSHQSDDLLALFQLCDVFVMPCAIETQSISTLEAMAAGKPIIAANGGALPELVKPGLNGYLFAPNDHVGLAEQLAALLPDEHMCQAFGLNSLVAITDHELDNSLGLYEKLYTRAAAVQPVEAWRAESIY